MGLVRRLGATALRLPHGSHRVTVRRDLRVPVADGVTLLADHYAPADHNGGKPPPTILVRSPYGRRGAFGLLCGYAFASHGFQAVVQSVRGGFGSGGVFEPLDERDDGLATIAWMKRQSWFGGTFAMHGPSYLGYVQWAVAAEAGPELKALSMQVTASSFHDAINIGGAFALEPTLTWVDLTTRTKSSLSGLAAGLISPRRARRAALSGRPLGELDALATGAPVRFFQEVLVHAHDSPFWRKRDFTSSVAEVLAPVNMTGGWYDVFLPWQLKDYATLRAAGRHPYLTIGPWFHADSRMMRGSFVEALSWFRAKLLDDPSDLREQPVRLYITGIGEWRGFPEWPVPGIREQRWHLQPDGGLGPQSPPESPPDTYRYDPAHPTPFLGGPVILGHGGPADQRRLESRRDVLTFTSPELTDDLEVIGPVAADLHIRSDRAHTDFVVRLCDVRPDGESRNLAEGARRLMPGEPHPDGDGVRRIRVELWPVGHRFRRGHRIRVQVCSGAYPRLARNPGTGEPIGTASEMVTANQEIFHSPDHASAIILPTV